MSAEILLKTKKLKCFSMKCFSISDRSLLCGSLTLRPFCPSGKNSVYMMMNMGHWWNDTDRSELKYSEKTCPSATLSTINPTWMAPQSNPGLRGQRSKFNRLIHGIAFQRSK